MIVLGLDVSLTATGWVAIRGDNDEADERPELLDQGKIPGGETPRDDTGRARRVHRIVEAVLQLVVQHQPNRIGIEDYSYGSVEQAHRVGELHGVLMHYLMRTEQVFDRVPIGTWRKLTLGNGQTPKELVAAGLLKRYGVEFKNVDIAEAYGVAVATWMRAIGADKPVSIRRRRREPAGLPLLDPFA